MLPTREESERQIRDVSPVILLAIFVASVVSAASSTAMLGIECWREYQRAQVLEQIRANASRQWTPMPTVDE